MLRKKKSNKMARITFPSSPPPPASPQPPSPAPHAPADGTWPRGWVCSRASKGFSRLVVNCRLPSTRVLIHLRVVVVRVYKCGNPKTTCVHFASSCISAHPRRFSLIPSLPLPSLPLFPLPPTPSLSPPHTQTHILTCEHSQRCTGTSGIHMHTDLRARP